MTNLLTTRWTCAPFPAFLTPFQTKIRFHSLFQTQLPLPPNVAWPPAPCPKLWVTTLNGRRGIEREIYVFCVCVRTLFSIRDQVCLCFVSYCQIRCIALRILQTSDGFWVFLFRQSSEWGLGYANHNKTRSQTASPACDSKETGKRNLRIIHYIKLKNFALLPAATSFCGQRGCGKRGN